MKLTHAKLRIIHSQWYQKLSDALGKEPEFQQELAKSLKRDRRMISMALNGDITYQKIQDKIANEVGISVGELFGNDAWFRVAAQRLKEREASQLATV